MKKREEFLKSIWLPYPVAPVGSASLGQARLNGQVDWVGGEVLQIRQHGAMGQMVLTAQGQRKEFLSPHLNLYSQAPGQDVRPQTVAAVEVLCPGDKVVVRQTQERVEIILLAPLRCEIELSPLTPEMAHLWQDFLRHGRAFFTARGFIEVSTPSLVVCPGFEPTLEPFTTELCFGKKQQKLFLPTSPEIHLKKILAQGWSEIFEIRSCFRNGEFSSQHQPEFTMLEWYRSYCGFEQLKKDVQLLFQDLCPQQNLKFSSYSVAELFRKVLKFELTPLTGPQELLQLSQQKEMGLKDNESESFNDLFHRLWVQWIDPWLGEQKEPLFVTHFPPSQAALSRLNSQGWAERLEVYWHGLELANGFHELNHPEEQRRRAEQDLNERIKQGRSPIANDEDFLKALERGMAPGVGIAVGLERLFMAIHEVKEISLLKAFPLKTE